MASAGGLKDQVLGKRVKAPLEEDKDSQESENSADDSQN